MEQIDGIRGLAGGAMIGLAAAAWLLLTGKTAGVSGMLYGLVRPEHGETSWKASFIGGLVIGGLLIRYWWPERIPRFEGANLWLLALAGLLVGFGTRLGDGCTSGHGVCGIGRLSWRSIVGTATFIALGAATVYVTRHWMGQR